MFEGIGVMLGLPLKKIGISISLEEMGSIISSGIKAAALIVLSFLTWSVFAEKGDSALVFQLNVLCIAMVLSRLTRTEFYRDLGTKITWLFSAILVLAAVILLADLLFSLLRFSPGFLRGGACLLVLLAVGAALIHALRKEKSIFKGGYWRIAGDILFPELAILLPPFGLLATVGIVSLLGIPWPMALAIASLYVGLLVAFVLRDRRRPRLAFLPAKVIMSLLGCMGATALLAVIA